MASLPDVLNQALALALANNSSKPPEPASTSFALPNAALPSPATCASTGGGTLFRSCVTCVSYETQLNFLNFSLFSLLITSLAASYPAASPSTFPLK